MIMPPPAIRPSSATPEKRSARTPGTRPTWPARRSGSARRRAARFPSWPRPDRRSRIGTRDSGPRTGSRSRPRYRRTARQSRPRRGSACRPRRRRTVTVSSRPRNSVIRIGMISRQVCTARNSHSVISTTLPIRPSTAPSATEANSSSASATWPVIRTCASPDLTNSRSAMTARIAAGGGAAGLQGAEILLRLHQHEPVRAGQVGRRRRPAGVCHDSGCGCPASASAIAVEALDRVEVGRQVGVALGHAHPEQGEGREQAAGGWVGDELAEEGLGVDGLVHQRRQLVLDRNSSPSFSRNGEASGRRTVRKCALSAPSRLASSAAVASASSGIFAPRRRPAGRGTGEVLVHLRRLLAPGQRRREHRHRCRW